MKGHVVAGLFLVASAAAQPSAPIFDVASIRPSQVGMAQTVETVPGSLTMRSISLARCIAWAYGVEEYQVSGPGWINDARFEVLGKSSTPAKEPELRQMLQALLAERFKLTLHRQNKELQALVLTVGKNGHKLEPTEIEGSPSFQTGKMNLTGKGATVGQLVQFLSHEIHIPVIDQTGLSGRFNYFLDINAYVTEEMRKGSGPPPEAASIVAQAIQSQLGLKLESKKAPVEMLVIDHIEKTPSEN
jgi:uncharacterized protein (TIGR03435 family)